jgi:HD-GYP domain-containing protein (c-di-GMP phosphodiesterase class II)
MHVEALGSPDPVEAGTMSPVLSRPGPSWDARLRGLVTALEARVPGAAGHAERVAGHSRAVAHRMGLASAEVRRVECAARVHDVGKIIVSPEILEKPGRLAPVEQVEIQRHAVFGARLVASFEDPGLTAIVRHHHERTDGSGYPDGLRGNDIPLGARIVAVADTFDALTAPRPYREAFSPGAAMSLLRDQAGSTLDRQVVAAFVS